MSSDDQPVRDFLASGVKALISKSAARGLSLQNVVADNLDVTQLRSLKRDLARFESTIGKFCFPERGGS